MDANAKILADAFAIAPSITAEHLALALGELGYVIRKAPAPRKAAAPVEVFAPNTGDPKVDAFMRAHHNPKYKPLPLPKAPGMKPLRVMTVSEQDAAERAYRSEAKRAAEDIAQGKMPEAERTLRELIALHRNPWVRAERRHDVGLVGVTIYESARHPGVEIHEHRSSSVGASRIYEVHVNGERHGDVHYAIKAAEDAADALVAALN